MKPFYRVMISIALVCALALGVAAQTPDKGVASKDAGARPDIAGTWLVNITFNDCGCGATPALLGPPLPGVKSQAPFVAVETFHQDGSFLETSLIDFLAPQGPPGQGVWERTGSREFALTFYGVSITDLVNPQLAGTYKVRSKLTLNRTGEEFTGPFVVELYDATGNLLFTIDGTAQGRRAHSEPLP